MIFTVDRILALSSLASALITTVLPSSASATVRFQVTELSGCILSDLNTGCFGQEITVGIRVGSDPQEDVFGIGASVYGYDASVADFVSGSAVSSIFHDFANPTVGAFGGIPNVEAGALNEDAIGINGNRVSILNAIDFAPHSENPLDPGLDGVVGGGDGQFRVRFRIVGVGQTVLTIDTRYSGDAVVYRGGRIGNSNTVQVVFPVEGLPYVVPEPGTAVLLGVGLVGLATRRSTHRGAETQR